MKELPVGVPVAEPLPLRRFGENWEPVYVEGFSSRTYAKALKAKGQYHRDEPAQRGMVEVKAEARAKQRPSKSSWTKLTLTEMLHRALKADDAYWAQRVINGLILKAAKGHSGAQKILWERSEGVLKEMVEVSGGLTFQKQVILTDLRHVPELPLETEGRTIDVAPGS